MTLRRSTRISKPTSQRCVPLTAMERKRKVKQRRKRVKENKNPIKKRARDATTKVLNNAIKIKKYKTVLLRCMRERENAPKWPSDQLLIKRGRRSTGRAFLRKVEVIKLDLKWSDLEEQKKLKSKSAKWLDENIDWKPTLQYKPGVFGHRINTSDGSDETSPLVFIHRFPPKSGEKSRKELMQLMKDAILGLVDKNSETYITPGSQTRKAMNGFLQIIFLLAGDRGTVVDQGDRSAKGENVNALYRDHQVQAAKFLDKIEPIRTVAERIMSIVFPDFFAYIKEIFQSQTEIDGKGLLPAIPFSGICINVVDPDGTVRTVVCHPHIDSRDGRDTWCCVIPICTGKGEWEDDSHQLLLPGIGVKINVRALDMVLFPSSLLVHYNSIGKDSDPQRASIVLFIHESILSMIVAGGKAPSLHPEVVEADKAFRANLKFQTGNAFFKPSTPGSSASPAAENTSGEAKMGKNQRKREERKVKADL